MAKEPIAVTAIKKQIEEQERKIAIAKQAFDLEVKVKELLTNALEILIASSPKKKKKEKVPATTTLGHKL